MIRKENVRATDRDRVDVYKSFRPGNIVLAKVVSNKDGQSAIVEIAVSLILFATLRINNAILPKLCFFD